MGNQQSRLITSPCPLTGAGVQGVGLVWPLGLNLASHGQQKHSMARHDKTKRIPKGSVIKRTPQGSTHNDVPSLGQSGFDWRIPQGSAQPSRPTARHEWICSNSGRPSKKLLNINYILSIYIHNINNRDNIVKI
jgi:hypothetical protein